MSELKPCPFCGGEAHMCFSAYRGERSVCCECIECGAVTDYVTDSESFGRAADAAAYLWNRRAERTCQDVEGGDFFRCSKCGCELMRVADGWKPLYMGEVNYCPNCGAKVVGE